jgi:hypothetical protein
LLVPQLHGPCELQSALQRCWTSHTSCSRAFTSGPGQEALWCCLDLWTWHESRSTCDMTECWALWFRNHFRRGHMLTAQLWSHRSLSKDASRAEMLYHPSPLKRQPCRQHHQELEHEFRYRPDSLGESNRPCPKLTGALHATLAHHACAIRSQRRTEVGEHSPAASRGLTRSVRTKQLMPVGTLPCSPRSVRGQ